jgi:hypothetical protein
MATVYPFDPSGTSPVNRISNEQQVITAQNFRDYHYVIPKFAPFFEDNFTIKLQYPSGATRNLVYGVDYYFSNQFLDASKACAKPIYGSISFLDTDTAGILSISYNTVGGMWNIDVSEITRILAEEMRNPRTTTWEQITNLPVRFPVVDHEWDLVDMVGAKDIVTALGDIRTAVLTTNGGGLGDHLTDYSNPHRVTKAQVGLSSVLNYAVATQQDAQLGTSNTLYMTPLRTADAITALGGALVNAHANNINNPHGVTKTQVGLGSVANYALATQTQAESGILNTAYMTPLSTAQAIAYQVGTAYTAHAANQLNPHNVTKDQVGLFYVQNYAIASQEEARAGLVNDKYMTPLRTSQFVSDFVTVNLNAHTQRTDNPHATTYDQVGAYSRDQIDTKLANYVMLNDQWVAGMTKDLFVAQVLTGTAANSTQFDGKTPAQFINDLTTTNTNLFAKINFKYSRDKATTTDPAATPYRWIKLGSVGILSNSDSHSPTSIFVSNPDAYWFMTGGHKQELIPSNNSKASSPAYLIHAKNGLQAGSHSFDVTRLTGAVDSDVLFGYTYDTSYSLLTVWVRVSYAYNDIHVARLTTLSNVQAFSDDSTVAEPAGIVYSAPVSYATNAALTLLADRVTVLENTVNSVNVA